MTLTLAGGHKVNEKAKHPSSLFFFFWCAHFSTDQVESWCGDEIVQIEHCGMDRIGYAVEKC